MTPDLSVTKLGWTATLSAADVEDVRAWQASERAWLALSPEARAEASRQARAAVEARHAVDVELHARITTALRDGAEVDVGWRVSSPWREMHEALLSIAERHAPRGDVLRSCTGCHEDETEWRDCPDVRDVAAAVGIEMEGSG